MISLIKKFIKIIFIFTTITLASCVQIYKKNIPQGNVLTYEQIEKLKLGLTKNQVINILGSPAILDVFHNNQFDYINKSIFNDGNNNIDYHLRLIFEDDKLIKIDKINTSSLNKKSN